jgi:hypothetical protein
VSDEEEVPKLPRGRGLKLSRPQLVRIGGMLFLLIALLVMAKPCASSVSKFVTSFDGSGSASSQMPKPGKVDVPGSDLDPDDYERLPDNPTPADIELAKQHQKAKAAKRAAEAKAAAAATAAQGSGSAGSAGSGSGSGSGL